MYEPFLSYLRVELYFVSNKLDDDIDDDIRRIFHIFPSYFFIHPVLTRTNYVVHLVPCFHPISPAFPLHPPPHFPAFTPLFLPAQNNPDVVQRVPVIPLSAAYKGPLPLTGQLSGERSSLMDELLEGEDLVKPLPTRGQNGAGAGSETDDTHTVPRHRRR